MKMSSEMKKLSEITLKSLEEQKNTCKKVLKAYKDLEKKLDADLLPFIVIANKNLLMVIEKQIEIIKNIKS